MIKCQKPAGDDTAATSVWFMLTCFMTTSTLSADNQLEMTTKRTIMENEQMSVELSYQSRQTEKLLSKNTVRDLVCVSQLV